LLPEAGVNPASLAAELVEFLRQRLVSLLEETGFDGDLVQAVAAAGLPLERVLGDPEDARRRAMLLAELRRSGGLSAVQAVVQRASRLAAKGDLDPSILAPSGVVNPALFESPAENAMLEALQQLEPIAAGARGGDYRELARGLAASADTLAAFFDGPQSVLVMADDPAVRRNRLHLLGVLRNQAALLADFERISGG
jgi:glycyl-tRNA synthetase beta chain